MSEDGEQKSFNMVLDESAQDLIDDLMEMVTQTHRMTQVIWVISIIFMVGFVLNFIIGRL